ncbi:alpha/beta fold hydrolase [Methanoregula sp.]|uniref:alpha/beta fold hydrolase n=1 Tax=Methanoregula sp. TaxID=2052170 RepID=UPI00236D4909|nr:alpha/beta fold hydrolase [Methanoregula sp.]MDD1686534.1 alpha/beta hydrolase [Methanoregula sp.]
MPKVHVNDIEMYYETRGGGEPLIVIWGIGGEIPPLADLLAESVDGKYSLILFDNRGSGRTDKPDMPYSIDLMADDTAGLMDAIGIRQAHVMGISTGARIALSLAARFPGRVKSLILHVAAARSPDKEDKAAGTSFERLRAAMTQPGFMEKVLPHPPTIASFLRQFEALREFDGRPLLGKIRAPTMIVNCTGDPSTPVRYAEELRDCIPGARLVMLDGDHLVARTSPDRLVQPLIAFLVEQGTRPANRESEEP